MKKPISILGVMILFCAGIVFIGCGEDDFQQHMVVDEPVEIDTSHIGMITGQVFSSKIENNQVVYEPYKQPEYGSVKQSEYGDQGAYIRILDSEFETVTTFDGRYSFDNVPTGTHVIRAFRNPAECYDDYPEFYNDDYPIDKKSITVIKQETVTVPDLKLIVEPVLKGKIYENDKITPFANEEVSLREWSGEKFDSTTTSIDGSYALKRSRLWGGGVVCNDNFYLKSPEAIIMFMDTNTEEISVPFRYDIVEKDAYVSEYK